MHQTHTFHACTHTQMHMHVHTEAYASIQHTHAHIHTQHINTMHVRRHISICSHVCVHTYVFTGQ